MLLCFLVNHVETATEISAGVLLLTSLASFQPQEAGELCEFDESMGNAMFVSHQWVTGRKFSHNAGNQFILWCACASFFLHWHTVLYCTITIYEPLTLQIYKSPSITGPINLVTSVFFFNAPHGPMSRIYPKVTSHHPDPATCLEEPHQWEMPSVTETCFGTHLWSIEMSKCTGLQSE